jgi:hypothetical protein
MKTTLLITLACCLSQAVFGQKTDSAPTLETVLEHIQVQRMLFPQEKIYLQTDKPYYIAGEKVFFRIFLLDAFSNQPAEISRYVYVELINPIDTVVIRQQIHPQPNALFYGALALPEYLPQGDYRIRAYTRFMENAGEACFYTQPVYIADPNAVRMAVEPTFDLDKNGQVGVNLRFSNPQTNESQTPEGVSVCLNRESPIALSGDSKGRINTTFKLAGDAPERTLLVEYVHDKKVLGQYLRIPVPQGKPAVSFYPEGGHIIEGRLNKIAFEALLPNGQATEARGTVFNSQGAAVSEFATLHEGMGLIALPAEPGECYYAVCYYEQDTLRVDIPASRGNTVSLATQWNRNRLSVTLNKPAGMPRQKLYLIAYCRGVVFYSGAWDWSKEYIALDKTQMPSGVSHFLLVTEDFHPLSERQVFFFNEAEQARAEIQPQAERFSRRERVELAVQLNKITPDTLPGTFAISVTDDQDVIPDTTSTILSYILLESEIQGPLFNAASYLSPQSETKADLLMMTHGWNRYAIPEAIQGDFRIPTHDLETSQRFSGVVKGGLSSKPYKGANVTLSDFNIGYYDMVETDADGRFELSGFEFPDSTQYMLQAQPSKGKDRLELYLDEAKYPAVTPGFSCHAHQDRRIIHPDFSEYVAKADRKYTTENGIRTIDLPEVAVKASRIEKKDYYRNEYNIRPDHILDATDLERAANPDPRMLLLRLPGVVINGGVISIHRSSTVSFKYSKPILFVIDGQRHEYKPGRDIDLVEFQKNTLNLINVADIVQVNLISGPQSIMYDADGGVIEFITKNKPAQLKKLKPVELPRYNTKAVIPLGYQQPLEFYAPKYDTQTALQSPLPDLRSTIYWKPDGIADLDGKASFDFYTADSPSTYSVIIEGVMPDGKLIYQRKKAVVTVK